MESTDPRIRHTRDVARAAAIQQLALHGLSGMTMEGVASAAGIAKSTLYRHWPEPSALLLDALASRHPQPEVPVDIRPIREQVVELLVHLAEAMVDPDVSAVLPALIEAAERDPAVAEHHHQHNDTRRQTLVKTLSEGVTRGELAPQLDPELAALALCGPIIYRRVMTAEPFPAAQVDGLVTQILGPGT